ncbi:MAG: 5'-methylthioadenosine/S-adenosylhomocysteine nucleosidase [Saprospiraceae bacterium]|nr:5'-methylthioadenosine/S-adenosylhomocysteine nucleosidase [Saprospiraceae bacterium]
MMTIDVLICTPLALEFDAVLRHLSDVKEDNSFAILRCKTGVFQNKQGRLLHIAVVETEPSIAKVSAATSKALATFKPSVVILTGIAGGVKDAQLGDLVVATEAFGYEHGKETDGGFAGRPNVLPYDSQLIKIAKNIAEEGVWKKRTGLNAQGSKVFFGPIASGDKVIASNKTHLYETLKKQYNNTLAVEMEAIGFARAVYGEDVKAINIRGISDLLVGKAEADAKGNQELVTQYAAAFVMELLFQLNIQENQTIMMETKTLASELFQAILHQLSPKGGNIAAGNSAIPNNFIQKVIALVSPSSYSSLRQDPTDEDIHGAFKIELRGVLEENKQLKEELNRLLESKNQGTTTVNITGKNIIQGSTISVGGNFVQGDGVKFHKE